MTKKLEQGGSQVVGLGGLLEHFKSAIWPIVTMACVSEMRTGNQTECWP